MKLILFGAGASYGSIAVSPHPPPLGKDLFTNLEQVRDYFTNVPKNIKGVFKENFEMGMKVYNEYTNYNTMQFQRELAGYFASFTPLRGNIYKKVINKFGINNIVYASLNYDLLFELSAAQLGVSTCYSINKNDGRASLLKIHGSCNFWPEMGGDIFENCTFENGTVDIEAPVRPLSRKQTLFYCKTNQLAPAIAHYAEGKSVKICRDYVTRQLDQWKEVASQANKIAIIGVKVHEADDHIWGILGKSKSELWYVGFNDDRNAFETWKNNHNKTNAYFIESDFEHCIEFLSKKICSKFMIYLNKKNLKM